MRQIKVDIADTPYSREMGLQFVKKLPDGYGMLFKFQKPEVLSFWMKNTYVPLDIAFMKDDGTIIKTERMIPLSLSSVSSGVPCSLALEVPAGILEKLGAEEGSMVSIDWETKTVGFQ